MLKYARAAGFVILVLATGYAVYQFARSGHQAQVLAHWRGQLGLLPLVLLLATVDVLLEAVGWMWVYERFGMRAWNRGGLCAYLAGRAGLLLPAQLGRLIRPDAMVRLGRGSMSDCLKAEAVAFVLDATSVVALLAGLVAWAVSPVLAPLALVAVIATALVLGNSLTRLLAGTRLALPKSFWWRWQTLAIVLIELAGWVAHGLGFYVILSGLSASLGLWQPLFYAPASAVLGVATGTPGGLGSTETLLGVSLKMMSIPEAHFAIVVGTFRLLTFGIWIPIGWLALLAVRQRARRVVEAVTTEIPDESVKPALTPAE